MADSAENESLFGRAAKFIKNAVVATAGTIVSVGVVWWFTNPTVYEFDIKHESCTKEKNSLACKEIKNLPEHFDSGEQYKLHFITKSRKIREHFNTLMKYTLSKLTSDPPKDYLNDRVYVYHLKGKEIFQLFPIKNKNDSFNCELEPERLANDLIQSGIQYTMKCNVLCKEGSLAIGESIYFVSFNDKDEKKTLSISNRDTFFNVYNQQIDTLGYKIPPLDFICKVASPPPPPPINCNNINNVDEFSKCINEIKDRDLTPISSLGLKYTAHTKKTEFKEPLELYNGIQLHSGDQYNIKLSPSNSVYVYIYTVDANGQFSDAIADSNGSNLLEIGKTHYIPPEGSSFTLDNNVGNEKIYVAAFNAPQPIFGYFNKQLALDKQKPSTETMAMQKNITNFFEHTFKQLTDIKTINHLP